MHALQLKDLQATAPALGGSTSTHWTISTVPLRRLAGSVPAALFAPQPKRIAELAVKSRVPTIATNRQMVEGGVLRSYGGNFPALYRRATTYVDKLLKGARPADLPIEQPTKFELVSTPGRPRRSGSPFHRRCYCGRIR